MNYKLIFGSLFALFVCSTLILYLIIPADNFDLDAVEGILKFKVLEGNSNFTLGNFTENMMQKNMSLRFPTPNITYKIYDCPLQKQTDMLDAFKIMENETILKFNPVESGEQIKIDCDGETKMEEGLFVGGEGGPTNVSNIGKMYVIFNGKILLIRDSKCERPNIAIHELLHVLGFTHSENKNNIMYSISKCSQTIGDDIPHHGWNTLSYFQMPPRQLAQAGGIDEEQRAVTGNAQDRIGVLGWEPRQGLDFTFCPSALADVTPDGSAVGDIAFFIPYG